MISRIDSPFLNRGKKSLHENDISSKPLPKLSLELSFWKAMLTQSQGRTPGHGGGYETDLPSLEKWEGFLDGRYNITRQAILQSSWDKFKREVDGVQEINDFDYGSEAYEQKRLAGGFWLPICYRDDIDIFSGQFPATCGLDWRNFYTGDFLSDINMGEGSKFWDDDQDDWPNSVILSHIPLVSPA
jgi:hypothetical protein